MADWNLKKVLAEIKKFSGESDREIINLAGWVWEEGMMFSKQEESDLSPSEEDKLISILNRLHTGEPIQYIVGHAWFYGLKMSVNPSVLIPRPETEELVGWILEDHITTTQRLRILDIGTGSGCIAIALKHVLKSSAEVVAVDISPEALNVAKQNALMLSSEIEFVQFDFLNSGLEELGTFDIIVSNPPYISKATTGDHVIGMLSYEPELALYPQSGDPDIFYKRMALFAPKLLHSGGHCYLEMNEYRAPEIEEYFHQTGWNYVEIKRDMQDKPRMIKIIA